MSVDWRIKPLQKEHDRTRLSCGEPELDDYLARFARQKGAKAFYARYEFETLPNQPLTLWLPLPLLRKFEIQPLPQE